MKLKINIKKIKITCKKKTKNPMTKLKKKLSLI